MRNRRVLSILTLFAGVASVPACSLSTASTQHVAQPLALDGTVSPQGYKLRKEKLFEGGGSWFTPAYYRGCELIGTIQYGATTVDHAQVYIAAGNGGNVPSGYMPYMYVYVNVIEEEPAEFQGTGLTMTMRSKFFKNYADADFFLFIYDTYNNLLAQSELGQPSGDAFTFPSLYQNGFIVKPPQGQSGNYFQLGYTYSGLSPLQRHPPECGA